KKRKKYLSGGPIYVHQNHHGCENFCGPRKSDLVTIFATANSLYLQYCHFMVGIDVYCHLVLSANPSDLTFETFMNSVASFKDEFSNNERIIYFELETGFKVLG